jgi:membrane protease YdiL (CAAX protease family)
MQTHTEITTRTPAESDVAPPTEDTAGRRASWPRRPSRTSLTFLGTFVAAWFALDRLVTSPPTLVSALVSLAVSGAIVIVGEWVLSGGPLRSTLRAVGLGPPVVRAVVAATIVGGAVVATFFGGAVLLGIDVELRSNWPTVLVAVLLFHGLAEELVWRGFVYGHLRRTRTFWRAILWSTPLIALTHVPIIATNGVGVGLLAVLTAIVTCLPFAYLYDRGGRTIWAPAILHGLIGTWQLFERTFPVQFSVLIMIGSILVPLSVFAFGDRFFGSAREA